MKIYYYAPTNSRIEVETAIDIEPKNLGTTAEHLAYALSSVKLLHTLTNLQAPTLSYDQLNLRLREHFVDVMNTHGETKKLLDENPLANNYNFVNNNKALAKHFILEYITEEKTENRIGKHRPDCLFTLEPINVGIKFKNDPNYYELLSAYDWIFNHGRNDSIATRRPWLKIEDILDFTNNIDVNHTRNIKRLVNKIQHKLNEIANSYRYLPRYQFAINIGIPISAFENQANMPDLHRLSAGSSSYIATFLNAGSFVATVLPLAFDSYIDSYASMHNLFQEYPSPEISMGEAYGVVLTDAILRAHAAFTILRQSNTYHNIRQSVTSFYARGSQLLFGRQNDRNAQSLADNQNDADNNHEPLRIEM